MNVVFWVSVSLILYAYGGYTVIMYILSRYWGNFIHVRGNCVEPLSVAIVVSAYNEDKVIAEKIINSLELNYPKGLLEIVVISDGSNDRTVEIVERFSSYGVVLKHFNERSGKTHCLNQVVPGLTSDIVVFTDADAFLDSEALIHMTDSFSNPEIGFVTGHTKYVLSDKTETGKSINIYSKIEKLTKIYESKIGSCVGADGAIFGIRKELYPILEPDDINDFVIPLKIVGKGYRGVLRENVFCSENATEKLKDEFHRQVRINVRTFRAILRNVKLLNPLKYGMYSYQLFSHKVIKYIVPVAILSAFITNIYSWRDGPIYTVTMIIQIVCYLLAFFEKYAREKYRGAIIFALPKSILMHNMAMLVAVVEFIKGRKYTTWSTG